MEIEEAADSSASPSSSAPSFYSEDSREEKEDTLGSREEGKEAGHRGLAPLLEGIQPSPVAATTRPSKPKVYRPSVAKGTSTCSKGEAQTPTTRGARVCANCRWAPCRRGEEVKLAFDVTTSCRLLSTKGGFFGKFPPMAAVVVKVQPESKCNALRVRWEGEAERGRPNSAPFPSKPKHKAPFVFHCREEVECANCGEAACLHGQPVTDVSKVVVGSSLVSCKYGYFRGMTPTLATVVAVTPSNHNIVVRWEWGACKEQQCPLPSTASHTPTFTYCCRGGEGKEESEQKEREVRKVREVEATEGWGPGAWCLEWKRRGNGARGPGFGRGALGAVMQKSLCWRSLLACDFEYRNLSIRNSDSGCHLHKNKPMQDGGDADAPCGLTD